MKKNKSRAKILHRVKNIWSCLTVLIILSILPIIFIPTCNRRYQLANKPQSIIKAIVIDEKDYLPNSPVSHEFYYKYSFIIDGAEFKGSSQSHDYRPGDSIKVEYVISNPQYNRPAQ